MDMSTDEKVLVLAQNAKEALISKASRLKVENQEDYEKASELLTYIKTGVKKIREEADKILVPAKQIVKEETAKWKPIIDQAEDAEVMVKQKMVAYVNEVDRKAKEEQEKIQKKLDDEKIKPATALKQAEKIEQAPKQVMNEAGGGSQVRKVRKVYIENPEVVPDQYWVIDESLVRRQALAGVEIPGVAVREENAIAGFTR